MPTVTLKDVAKETGLNFRSVSQVLNGTGGRYSEDTQRRVREAAQRLGYRPNALARAMASGGRTRTIGVVGFESRAMMNLEFLISLSQELDSVGWRMLLALRKQGDVKREREHIDDFLSRRVDGLLISADPATDSKFYSTLRERSGVPVVVSGGTGAVAAPVVLVDSVGAMREATQHLIDLGHRRLAYAVGADAFEVPSHRVTGFFGALKDAGIPVQKGWVLDDVVCTRESAAAFTRRILEASPRPTAIMYINDEMALVGLHTILDMGLRVPEDVSVVGFDDLPLAQLTWPELTTVRQPLPAIARESLRMLGVFDDELPRTSSRRAQKMIRPELIIRRSTGPAPL